MTIEIPVEVPPISELYRSLWKMAALIGALAAAACTKWPSITNAVIGTTLIVGILSGVMLGIFLCLAQDAEEEEENPLLFTSNLWLQLAAHKECSDQLDLFEKETIDPQDRRRVYRFVTSEREILVMRCDRFQELLVARIVEEVDKATEHALMIAFKRVQGEAQPKLRPLLSKVFREIVKSDFRGNLLTLLSRQSMKIEEEMRLSAEPPKPTESEFTLLVVPSNAPKLPSPGKSRRRPAKQQ